MTRWRREPGGCRRHASPGRRPVLRSHCDGSPRPRATHRRPAHDPRHGADARPRVRRAARRRDLAGMLSVLLEVGVLVNATALTWAEPLAALRARAG